MSNFLQFPGKLLVCGTMAPFKCYEQRSELVKMHLCLYNKQEKDFKKEEVKQRAWKEIAKELELEYGLSDVFCIDVEPKLMTPEAVNDVCMPSLCFYERIFSSRFGDNISGNESAIEICWAIQKYRLKNVAITWEQKWR